MWKLFGANKKRDPVQPALPFTSAQTPTPFAATQPLTHQDEINDEHGFTPDLTQCTDIDGVLVKNGETNSPSNENSPSDNSLFAATPIKKPDRSKKPSTPYPYDMIRAINEAIGHSPQPEIVEKSVHQAGHVKNIVSYYTCTPMTKTDTEDSLNIAIENERDEDLGDEELGIKRSAPDSVNQSPNKRIKMIRYTETWERIESNADHL